MRRLPGPLVQLAAQALARAGRSAPRQARGRACSSASRRSRFPRGARLAERLGPLAGARVRGRPRGRRGVRAAHHLGRAAREPAARERGRPARAARDPVQRRPRTPGGRHRRRAPRRPRPRERTRARAGADAAGGRAHGRDRRRRRAGAHRLSAAGTPSRRTTSGRCPRRAPCPRSGRFFARDALWGVARARATRRWLGRSPSSWRATRRCTWRSGPRSCSTS